MLANPRRCYRPYRTKAAEVQSRCVPASAEMDRLLRYETTLERSFDRTLSQLERAQRLRQEQPVPPELNVRVSQEP